MRTYLISDNIDTLTGMRLAGVIGEVAHTAEAFSACFERVMSMGDIGIVFVTQKAAELAPDIINNVVLHSKLPLVTVIPDRHASESEDNKR